MATPGSLPRRHRRRASLIVAGSDAPLPPPAPDGGLDPRPPTAWPRGRSTTTGCWWRRPRPATGRPWTLLHRHHDRLRALCRRMCGNEADADDATQEALIAVVRGLRPSTVARPSPPGPTGWPPTPASTSCADGPGAPRPWAETDDATGRSSAGRTAFHRRRRHRRGPPGPRCRPGPTGSRGPGRRRPARRVRLRLRRHRRDPRHPRRDRPIPDLQRPGPAGRSDRFREPSPADRPTIDHGPPEPMAATPAENR